MTLYTRIDHSFMSIPCPKCGYGYAEVVVGANLSNSNVSARRVDLTCVGCDNSSVIGYGETPREAARVAINKYVESILDAK